METQYEQRRVEWNLQHARQRNAVANLTLDQWLETLEYFDYRCAFCGGEYQELEHYIPLNRGGGTTVSNCVPCCRLCNRRKDNRDRQNVTVYDNKRVIEFLESKGVKISVHAHTYHYEIGKYVGIAEIVCGCGDRYEILGGSQEAKTSIADTSGRLGNVTAIPDYNIG